MWPGLVLAATFGFVGYVGEELEFALTNQRVFEALVIAMISGVAARNLVRLPARTQDGTTFASKQVLEFAVVVLGASIDVNRVFDAGFLLIVAVTSGVLVGMITSYLLGKALGLESRLAYLVAVGNSICGNSAIAAVAPVIKAEKREITSAIGVTAVAGVLIILLLPAIVPVLGLSHYQYGVIVGMAVYAMPQVVAAGYAVSHTSGEVATLVKLLRVMFIGPVVIATGLFIKARGGGDYYLKRSQILPWFVVGFFLLLMLRSSGVIPESAIHPIQDLGRLLTILAMAGLGLGVEFAAIKSVGPRVGVTSVLSMVMLIVLSLSLVSILRLNSP
jgi:uncharacterized integral membrane protein (TIGR00698 family)